MEQEKNRKTIAAAGGPNMFDTAVFDLDGTLLDTLEDIAGSVNYVLGELGFPPVSLEKVY